MNCPLFKKHRWRPLIYAIPRGEGHSDYKTDHGKQICECGATSTLGNSAQVKTMAREKLWN